MRGRSILAPTGPSPVLTMVTRCTCARGALTSAATLGSTWGEVARGGMGTTFSIMSTSAASPYSFQASAFLAICSASALAFTSMAYASASPLTARASASASASSTVRDFSASAILSSRNFSASAGFRI